MIWSAEASRWFLRLQRDVHAPVVERGRRAAGADRHGIRGDGRILGDDVAERLLLVHHVGERDVLGGLGDAGDEAGILLREEALGDHDEQMTVSPRSRNRRSSVRKRWRRTTSRPRS